MSWPTHDAPSPLECDEFRSWSHKILVDQIEREREAHEAYWQRLSERVGFFCLGIITMSIFVWIFR